MGDNHHVYRRISQGLRQLYPKQMTGRQARHMNTLAGMVSGIVRSGKCQLKAMAKKAPDRSKVESRSKRFTRYVQNEQVDAQTYYLPFIEALLIGLARCGPLVLVMDGSEVGRGCLVTNMELAAEACFWYRKRFSIETFFSDQKSRGFHLHKSHLADPERMARLLIAACLAYLWLIYLGAIAHRDNWVPIIHRPDRCDLSLFQLGLDLLEHFLNESMPISVAFSMPQAAN